MDPSVVDQKSGVDAMSTPLHLAAMLGLAKLVEEILKLRPHLVAEENNEGETPLHEACRQGNSRVLQLLLENYPTAASKLHYKNQSPFFLACQHGHEDIVKIMLPQRWLMELEEDQFDSIPLHVALQRGHTGIIKKTLQARPDFAKKVDKNGHSLPHFACLEGDVEVAGLLLSIESGLAFQYKNSGYTPLNLAIMKGHITVLDAFLSLSPDPFRFLTKNEETVFRVAVRFGYSDLFKYLTERSGISELVNNQDKWGYTTLHRAILVGNYQLIKSVMSTMIDVNLKNSEGKSTLEILESAWTNRQEVEQIKELFQGAANSQLQEVEVAVTTDDTKKIFLPSQVKSNSGNFPLQERVTSSSLHCQDQKSKSQLDHHTSKQNKKTEPESRDSEFTVIFHKPDYSNLRRKKLQEVHQNDSNKKEEQMHREAMLNARNTIALVAVLITTVKFTAGVYPPGGVLTPVSSKKNCPQDRLWKSLDENS